MRSEPSQNDRELENIALFRSGHSTTRFDYPAQVALQSPFHTASTIFEPLKATVVRPAALGFGLDKLDSRRKAVFRISLQAVILGPAADCTVLCSKISARMSTLVERRGRNFYLVATPLSCSKLHCKSRSG